MNHDVTPGIKTIIMRMGDVFFGRIGNFQRQMKSTFVILVADDVAAFRCFAITLFFFSANRTKSQRNGIPFYFLATGFEYENSFSLEYDNFISPGACLGWISGEKKNQETETNFAHAMSILQGQALPCKMCVNKTFTGVRFRII